MKGMRKVLLLSLFVGIYMGIFFLQNSGDIYLSEIVIYGTFGRPEFDYYNIVNVMTRCIPLGLFIFLFGREMYGRFDSASVYVFTRCTNRRKWIILQMLKLYGCSLAYTVFTIVVCAAMASLKSGIIYDKTSFIIVFYYVVIYSFFLWGSVLVVNMISLKAGAVTGSMIMLCFMGISTILMSLWNKAFPLVVSDEVTREQVIANGNLLKYNFMTHLVIPWHSSNIPAVDERIRLYNINYDLNISVLVMVVFGISASIICYMLYKKAEYISVYKERM